VLNEGVGEVKMLLLEPGKQIHHLFKFEIDSIEEVVGQKTIFPRE
jgi:hypothetical protein